MQFPLAFPNEILQYEKKNSNSQADPYKSEVVKIRNNLQNKELRQLQVVEGTYEERTV